MKSLLKSLGWYLYGGVTCYCFQQFLIDFVNVKENAHDLFQSGDVIILDVLNRLELKRYRCFSFEFVINPFERKSPCQTKRDGKH